MAALSLTNPTLAGTMDASLLQQNYTDIVNYVNGSVLRSDGTTAMAAALSTTNNDPTVAAQIVRKAYKDGAVVIEMTGASQPISIAGTWYQIVFTTEVRDGTNGANASNNYSGSGFTAPVAGLYRFEVGVFNASLANDTATWYSRLLINGTTVITGPSVCPNKIGGFTDPSMSFSASWYLAAGDVVTPQVKSSSGYIPNKTVGNHFMAAWVHA